MTARHSLVILREFSTRLGVFHCLGFLENLTIASWPHGKHRLRQASCVQELILIVLRYLKGIRVVRLSC